jgi:hypothetical protein
MRRHTVLVEMCEEGRAQTYLPTYNVTHLCSVIRRLSSQSGKISLASVRSGSISQTSMPL